MAPRSADPIQATIEAVRACDPRWLDRAEACQRTLTMPAGSLGRLMELGQQLCAVQETLHPAADPAAVVVCAADHGVARAGVSAYPQEVTGQMVANFLAGGAAISVMARRLGVRVVVVDLGVIAPPSAPGADAEFIRCPVAAGTRNFAAEAAMSPDQARAAIGSGMAVAERLAGAGIRMVGLGEMGIGNTTSASALAAALTGLPAGRVTGRGTGVDDAQLAHKVDVIRGAIELHRPDPADPLGTLAALGGFEIAGLVGLALAAARHRLVVVLDGFISSVAGLVALRLCPALRDYLVAAHRSVEIGHRAVLDALGLAPLLDLQMRLGEATGAVLAIDLIRTSAALLTEMATFDQANVQKEPARTQERQGAS